MSNASPPRPSVMLDYSVVDHLRRVDAGQYNGKRESALRQLRALAEAKELDAWMSEITQVEMLHGLENLDASSPKHEAARKKDDAKLAIAKAMHIRWLGYPCSKFGDTYSRFDLSFRLADANSPGQYALEERLLRIPGVSEGDARQLVSLVEPFDGNLVHVRPPLDWFVAEDERLINAMTTACRAGTLPELAQVRFGTSEEFVAFVDTSRASV